MTPVRDLAAKLMLTDVSVRFYCRRNAIETYRRLPEGKNSGQLIAHVRDRDAKRIREHYRDRLADRSG